MDICLTQYQVFVKYSLPRRIECVVPLSSKQTSSFISTILIFALVKKYIINMMNNNIIEINNKLNKLKTFLKISCPKIIHVLK